MVASTAEPLMCGCPDCDKLNMMEGMMKMGFVFLLQKISKDVSMRQKCVINFVFNLFIAGCWHCGEQCCSSGPDYLTCMAGDLNMFRMYM